MQNNTTKLLGRNGYKIDNRFIRMGKVAGKGIVLLFMTIVLSLGISLGAQEKKSPSGADEITSKEIEKLQRELSDLIQSAIGEEKRDEFKIPLGMGLKRQPGHRERFVYVEEARIKLSNGVPESIEFYYYQSNEKTVFTQERSIVNNSVRGQDLGKLIVAYKSNMDDPVTYTVESLQSENSRQRVLSMYRDYLMESVKVMNILKANKRETEAVTLQKVLYLGTK